MVGTFPRILLVGLRGSTMLFSARSCRFVMSSPGSNRSEPKSRPFLFFFWYGGFLKWWYPTTILFPTKNDHFGVFWVLVPPFQETPISKSVKLQLPNCNNWGRIWKLLVEGPIFGGELACSWLNQRESPRFLTQQIDVQLKVHFPPTKVGELFGDFPGCCNTKKTHPETTSDFFIRKSHENHFQLLEFCDSLISQRGERNKKTHEPRKNPGPLTFHEILVV